MKTIERDDEYLFGVKVSGVDSPGIDKQERMMKNGIWGPILKQKDFVEWENCPPSKATYMQTKVTNKDVTTAILACIHITNVNLINMNNRLQKNSNEVKKVILQSDATAVFKGNMIRVLKQLFDSATINIIKSRMSYVIKLDDVHPVIERVNVVWPPLPDFRGQAYKQIRNQVMDMFLCLSDSDINDQATLAMKETQQVKPVFKSEVLSFDSISFDSIKQIKF